MSEFYFWQGDDLVILLKINARSSLDKMEVGDERLRVHITTPPEKGKANRHLIKYFSRAFAVAPPKTLPSFISRP